MAVQKDPKDMKLGELVDAIISVRDKIHVQRYHKNDLLNSVLPGYEKECNIYKEELTRREAQYY